MAHKGRLSAKQAIVLSYEPLLHFSSFAPGLARASKDLSLRPTLHTWLTALRREFMLGSITGGGHREVNQSKTEIFGSCTWQNYSALATQDYKFSFGKFQESGTPLLMHGQRKLPLSLIKKNFRKSWALLVSNPVASLLLEGWTVASWTPDPPTSVSKRS
ncbi:hypothetical protein AYL99_05298 [Fonsecaea erecta]|uniref:Uncharacterized protein n=1 Tax=Fonsecaea erecta TaxID=1367422 RepID=A0A178ZLL7_9EURO|nr:hypothetical protein AYL99_05298 [Fonsecaea erecta]OAP60296.1 hypothetical protein AYL99_05298 [Fonsecaea erecta]